MLRRANGIRPRGNLATPVVLGHIEHEAAGFAASSIYGLGGLGGSVAVDVEDSNLCSILRIAQRNRSADARPATGDHRNAFLEKPWHFPSSVPSEALQGYPAGSAPEPLAETAHTPARGSTLYGEVSPT
jgi:hypothetical protein